MTLERKTEILTEQVVKANQIIERQGFAEVFDAVLFEGTTLKIKKKSTNEYMAPCDAVQAAKDILKETKGIEC